MPVMGVGRYTDPDHMASLVRGGAFDIIGCARPSIADPFLPRKIDEGRVDDVRECIGCNFCAARFAQGVTIVCTQNPTALEEFRRGWHPEDVPPVDKGHTPVVVVGAGVAGLECARVLGERGVRVHLMEQEAEVGGHLRRWAKMLGMAEWWKTVTWRVSQLSKLPSVELMKGVGEVDAPDLMDFAASVGASKVVLCTGAVWRGDGTSYLNPQDPVPGVDASSPYCVTPEQYWAGKTVGRRVVIADADGYLLPVLLAQELAESGHEVTIVTPMDCVMPAGWFHAEFLTTQRLLRELRVQSITQRWLDHVEPAPPGAPLRAATYDLYRDGHARGTDATVPGAFPRRVSSEVSWLECDTLLLCSGRRSNDVLWRAAKAHAAAAGSCAADPAIGPELYRCGDCLAPRYLADAVFDGHRVGREIDGADPERPRAVRRERAIWGATPVIPELGDPVL